MNAWLVWITPEKRLRVEAEHYYHDPAGGFLEFFNDTRMSSHQVFAKGSWLSMKSIPWERYIKEPEA